VTVFDGEDPALPCACVSSDARTCIRLRYPVSDFDDLEGLSNLDRCECCCHDMDEDDYDDYENNF
jgi:hypothetical protein